ncbi:hypothetical protein Tcan_04876 [Toxocara canis]|uniref:Uncharacterized protein n=1 Tax=Toxocara canis TaxID=6265 RepID=A0A0B2VEI0_TOXCA|nr:hypothetical protein Tcan_04876 [Toxocara canis]
MCSRMCLIYSSFRRYLISTVTLPFVHQAKPSSQGATIHRKLWRICLSDIRYSSTLRRLASSPTLCYPVCALFADVFTRSHVEQNNSLAFDGLTFRDRRPLAQDNIKWKGWPRTKHIADNERHSEQQRLLRVIQTSVPALNFSFLAAKIACLFLINLFRNYNSKILQTSELIPIGGNHPRFASFGHFCRCGVLHDLSKE